MNVSEDLLLKVLNGDLRGHRLSLRESLAIGSNRGCDLHLRDAAVSWNHARLWRDGKELLVEDLGSANGTFLNDRAIERASLQPGDRLRIGNTEISLLADRRDGPSGSMKGPQSAASGVSGDSSGDSSGTVADAPAGGSSEGSRKPGRPISLLERAESAERELHRLKREQNSRLEAADRTSADLQTALEQGASLEEERRRLQREVRKLEKRLRSAGQDHAEIEERNQDLEQRVRASLEELEGAASERETLLRDQKGLERARDAALNEGEASRTRIRSLHGEIETLRDEISSRDGSSSQVQDAHRLEVAELEGQIREVEAREHEGHKQWDSLSSESDRLRTRLDETLESVSRLEARIDESQSREADLGARLLEKERDLALQEGALATANATVERLQKDSDSLESALDAERKTSRDSISDLRRQCEELVELRIADANRFREEIQLLAENHREQLAQAEEH